MVQQKTLIVKVIFGAYQHSPGGEVVKAPAVGRQFTAKRLHGADFIT
jgi:hypothetical protein